MYPNIMDFSIYTIDSLSVVNNSYVSQGSHKKCYFLFYPNSTTLLSRGADPYPGVFGRIRNRVFFALKLDMSTGFFLSRKSDMNTEFFSDSDPTGSVTMLQPWPHILAYKVERISTRTHEGCLFSLVGLLARLRVSFQFHSLNKFFVLFLSIYGSATLV